MCDSNHTTEKMRTARKTARRSQIQRPTTTSAFRNNSRKPLLLQNLTHITRRIFSLKSRLLDAALDPCYQRCGRWLFLFIDGL